MIDLELALYSRCEHDGGADAVPACYHGIIEAVVADVLGAPYRIDRLATFLQGPVQFLHAEAEFRVHLWVSLPEGHPRFPDADRGLVSLVQEITPDRLVGPVRVEVGWLGRPLPLGFAQAAPGDWIRQMELDQGYLDIPDTTWGVETTDAVVVALMSYMVSAHCEGMVSRRLLERALGFEPASGLVAIRKGDDC